MMEKTKKIGVLCSGGDAPGMNPCLRAIIRAGVKYDYDIVGIRHGYTGLLAEEFWNDGKPFEPGDVSGMTNRGGAFLNSSRCKEMYTEEGVKRAAEILVKNNFDALIAIGGNGTLTGARDISRIWDGQVIGLPGTIDNDLLGTDLTIGFATAVDTGVQAVDKLRDTAGSHDMMFLVEVMGRHCGDLAAYIALAGGCELVAVPETKTSIPDIVEALHRFKARGKRSIIMVVAEGDDFGSANDIMKALREANAPFEMRCLVLGHLQRGGSPVPVDRILGTELGCAAIDAIHDGETGKMVGQVKGEFKLSPLDEVICGNRHMSEQVAREIKRLSV